MSTCVGFVFNAHYHKGHPSSDLFATERRKLKAFQIIRKVDVWLVFREAWERVTIMVGRWSGKPEILLWLSPSLTVWDDRPEIIKSKHQSIFYEPSWTLLYHAPNEIGHSSAVTKSVTKVRKQKPWAWVRLTIIWLKRQRRQHMLDPHSCHHLERQKRLNRKFS